MRSNALGLPGELVGNFKNAGQVWAREPTAVNVHDYPHDALGRAVPYGVYDADSSGLAPRATRRRSPSIPSQRGGTPKGKRDSLERTTFWCWPTLAAAIAAKLEPGRNDCKSNSAIASA